MRNATKRKVGATASAVVLGGMLMVLAICMVGDYFWSGWDTQETVVLAISVVAVLGTVVGILVALRQRWKEIEGGEEDEARKY